MDKYSLWQQQQARTDTTLTLSMVNHWHRYSYTKQTDEVSEKDVDALLNGNRLRKKQWFYKDNTYTIIRYDKRC